MQFFYNHTQFCEFLQNPSTQQNHKLVVCWVLSYVTVVLPVSTRIWPGMFIMIRHFLFLRPTSIPNFFIHDETSWSPGSWSYGLMILGSWSHDPPGYGTWSPGHIVPYLTPQMILTMVVVSAVSSVSCQLWSAD